MIVGLFVDEKCKVLSSFSKPNSDCRKKRKDVSYKQHLKFLSDEDVVSSCSSLEHASELVIRRSWVRLLIEALRFPFFILTMPVSLI